jgi:hypothetical protein
VTSRSHRTTSVLHNLTIVLSTRCAHRGNNEVLESLVLILHCLYYAAKALITKTRSVQAIRVDAQSLPAKAHGGRSQLTETHSMQTAQRAILQTSLHIIGDHQFVHLYISCVLQNVVVTNSRVWCWCHTGTFTSMSISRQGSVFQGQCIHIR